MLDSVDHKTLCINFSINIPELNDLMQTMSQLINKRHPGQLATISNATLHHKLKLMTQQEIVTTLYINHLIQKPMYQKETPFNLYICGAG